MGKTISKVTSNLHWINRVPISRKYRLRRVEDLGFYPVGKVTIDNAKKIQKNYKKTHKNSKLIIVEPKGD